MENTENVENTGQEVAQEAPKKKSSVGRIILIVVLVILLLLILCGLGGYFLARNFVFDTLESIGIDIEQLEEIDEEALDEDIEEIDPFEFEEEPAERDVDEEPVEMADLPEINDDLLNEDLISEKMNQDGDIPIPGGEVRSSSFNSNRGRVDLEIRTSSAVDEVYYWFEEELKETDWIIGEKSRDDESARITADNGESALDDDYRAFSVSIRYREQVYDHQDPTHTSIEIVEERRAWRD